MSKFFVKSVDPPKLTRPFGVTMGRIAAILMVIMALIHLFRIDTLIPIVDKALPGGSVAASLFVVIVVLAEVFGIPFLLRVKLSPLAHIFSGFLVILAPLMWALLAIWSYGMPYSIGQFGQFAETKSTLVLMSGNIAWLAYNFITIWSLGYNNLKLKDLTAKTQSSSKKSASGKK